jgi:hypothetical protein
LFIGCSPQTEREGKFSHSRHAVILYFTNACCQSFRNLKLSVASVTPALGSGVNVFITDRMKLQNMILG